MLPSPYLLSMGDVSCGHWFLRQRPLLFAQRGQGSCQRGSRLEGPGPRSRRSVHRVQRTVETRRFFRRVSRGVYLDCRIGKSGVFVARDVGVGVGGAVCGCAAANNRRVRGCGCGCGVWAGVLPITVVSVRASLGGIAIIVVLLFI